jgi:hypothetical protein
LFRVQSAYVKVRTAWIPASCFPPAGETIVPVKPADAASIGGKSIVACTAITRWKKWQAFSTGIWLKDIFYEICSVIEHCLWRVIVVILDFEMVLSGLNTVFFGIRDL